MKILKTAIIVLVAAIIVLVILFFLGGGSFADRVVCIGDRAAQNSSYEKAEKYYNFVLKINKDNVCARQSLGETYAAEGNYTKSEAFLNDCISTYPEEAEFYLSLCRVYVAQDKLADAVALLDGVENATAAEGIAAARPETPTFYPDAGKYTESISATIFFSSDSDCYYSESEEYPSVNGSIYSQPISLDSEETVITAVAVSKDGLVSKTVSTAYTVGDVIKTVTLKDLTIDAMVRDQLGKSADDVIWSDELWSMTALSSTNDSGQSYGSILRLDDLQYFKGLETLYIEGQENLDLSQLQQLENLKTLTLKDCGISTGDLDTISQLTGLRYLNLSGNHIAGVTAIGNMTTLIRLNLSDNSLSDLSGLGGASALEALDISGNAVADISPLSAITGLKELYGKYLLITDLTPLSGMTGLTILELPGCDVSDLTPLSGCTALQTLSLAQNSVTDVTALGGCTALVYVDLSRNAITAIGGMAKLPALEYLDVSDNAIGALPSTMSGLSALTTVFLSGNSINSVSPLAGCKNLEYINIEYCPVGDISVLASLGKLDTVMAFGTNIQDRGGLENNGVTVFWDLNM